MLVVEEVVLTQAQITELEDLVAAEMVADILVVELPPIMGKQIKVAEEVVVEHLVRHNSQQEMEDQESSSSDTCSTNYGPLR